MKHSLPKLICSFIVFILSAIVCSRSIAQVPPSNDDCAGAILVSTYPYSDLGGVYTDVNTTGATRSTPNPSCITSSDNNDDVWYKFVAVSQVEYLRVHSVVSGSSYVTCGYALYDACGGTQISCNNSLATFNGGDLLGGLTPGNTYYLRLWSQYNFTFMSLSFCVQDITAIAAPDESSTALALPINAAGQHCITPQFYTTASATRSSPNPTCSNANDDDVWFQFTMPSHSVYIITEEGAENTTGILATLGLEIFDATIGVSTSCTAIYPAGSITLISGITGHIYQLRFWSRGAPATFSLCLQDGYEVLPLNDACSAATELVVGAGSCTSSVLGNLFNANTTVGMTGNPNCATPNSALTNDVWYKVTVPSTGNVVIQTSATHTAVNDVLMQAYSGTCGALTEIACDEDGNPDAFPSANHSRISFSGRTPGEIIYVRVVPRNADNKGEFSICAFDETASTISYVTVLDTIRLEGNAGTSKMKFAVKLSPAADTTVLVGFKTFDGTATQPTDYTKKNLGVLAFNPGDTLKYASITINGDVTTESDETFTLKLIGSTNAVITDSFATGTIKNDDPAPFSSTNNSSDAIAKNNGFKIFPNPVTDKLNIQLPESNSKYSLLITDVTGRNIQQLQAQSGGRNISISTKDLTSGIYFLKIQSLNETVSLKFIKM